MSGTVLVIAEAGDAGLRPVSLELITAGRAVATAAGSDLTALILGANVADSAAKLAAAGADRVLVVDDERLKFLTPALLAHAVAQAIGSLQPFAVLVPSTTAGIEYAPRVAARLGLPIASDAIGLAVEEGSLVALRPILGGRVQSAVKLNNAGPAIVTVRQGSFEKAADSGGGVAPEPFAVDFSGADQRIRVTGVAEKESGDVGLDTAKTIVGGGRGLKEPGNFSLVEELAQGLGGAVAATRAVTDAGWRPHHEQIGQTGRIVSPRLYIAVGISGAAQHVTGLQGAENIVAINRDPDAPIFKIASFGIVGDLFEVVPAILAELKATA